MQLDSLKPHSRSMCYLYQDGGYLYVLVACSTVVSNKKPSSLLCRKKISTPLFRESVASENGFEKERKQQNKDSTYECPKSERNFDKAARIVGALRQNFH
ncbi:hypothetical protein CEXT_39651 [Caerostris extrusa]|uniref:Uncharacterized protein n=1 Tax=Caerostris extrusa TaxID=172846 RepID=A0AAV4UAD1_CAEEX|nr:hypothetical protein CEXT_39651 [Caerostris extrusa]